MRCFFVQAEDGIRDLVRSRGLGDVYKRQVPGLEEERVGRRGLELLPAGWDPLPEEVGPEPALSLIHI